MPSKKPFRILIAEDDARWLNEISIDPAFEVTVATNLIDAMALIDRRRRWNAAVFDRYLMEGDTPFEPGKLISEAGFLLAVAFKDKF
ncbi:MAG TPA: hypothetical protein EYQ50_25550 [Verrucomicrobiales bacterium]|nr:hypothetical protein [Verrucomicrobiales bacterium]HIL70915.1 hypothetical protein [Verrucomicrobiota bacterium]